MAILGFIPGVTSNYDQLQMFGHHSGALLLGLFNVSVLHNIVHGLFGVAGLVMARTASGARSFLLWGGVIYAALWLYGLFVPFETPANFVPLNTADNWLHLVLAASMIGLGILLGRRRI